MAQLKPGDLVRIEYSGKLASTGALFESTSEAESKKAGIHLPNKIYGPRLAIYGKGMMLAGIENAIKIAKLGQPMDFLLEPQHAFGKRDENLARVIPLTAFKKQGLWPVPGMALSLDGMAATVRSINSGRVQVDFNHPLAGQRVIYTIKLLEIISDPKKKIAALFAENRIKARVEDTKAGLVIRAEGELDERLAMHLKGLLEAAVPEAKFEFRAIKKSK